jgi:UDP-3-O-[3-hydroxymyristoyl] glucosamine N-acyltransferase
MTTYSLDELARATGLSVIGDGTIRVGTPSEPDAAGPDDLALAMDKKFGTRLAASAARAAVVWDGADLGELGLEGALVATRPRVALAHVTAAFQHAPDVGEGIHATAVIDPTAKIGAGAAIGPFVVVGAGVEIGANAIIAAHVSIGVDARIGDNALLHPGVRIGARCVIGDAFIAQPNAVIGADGFSFEPPQRGAVEQARQTGSVAENRTTGFLRIHSLAAVEIGNDVEVGASTTIDRGTIAPTRIGSGTKIDNQVQIGHNVQVGETCLLCAFVGLAGSVRIGDRVVLGGKVGVGDHLKIGSDVVCAAGTLVAGNVPDRSVMMGIPATTRDQATRQIVAVKRLPRLLDQMAEIRKKLGM